MSQASVEERPWAGFGVVGAAYAVALLVASVVLQLTPGWAPLGRVAAADGAATVTVFVFSRVFDNSSVYDPYWSVAPALIAWWLALEGGGAGPLGFREGALLVLLTVYGARLTFHWARGWAGLADEDWRYAELRRASGRAYWVVSLLGIHLLPSAVVFLGCLPLFAVLGPGAAATSWLDGLAAVVTAAGVALEAVADEQLRAFRRAHDSAAVCEVGLWRSSRHPNYFGELLLWLGLFLFGLAAGGPRWHGAGALAMVGLFAFVSVPLAERRSLARRPGFAAYRQAVSMLVPLPRRRPPA